MQARLSFAALVAGALMLPLAAQAGGDTGYNPNAQAPAPQADFDYFCAAAGTAGNVRYITHVHHLGNALALAAQHFNPVNLAWQQAIKKSQQYSYNAVCVFSAPGDAEKTRQVYLTEQSMQIVHIHWEYGQSGPATVVSAALSAPAAPAAAAANATAQAPASPAATAAQAAADAAKAQTNAAINQATQNLLNKFIPH